MSEQENKKDNNGIEDDSVFSDSKKSPKKMGDDKKELDATDGRTRHHSSTSAPLKPGEQNIVIALDGSEQSVQAVNWYLEKVHRPGNRLVFVHVIELPEPKLNEARSLHMSPGVLASMWKEEEARVKELEQKMKTLLKEKQIKGVLRTATGKPGEVICRIAEEELAAMICVGTRGMGRVRRTILGSVSDYLVHHASCPVIVCRARSRKQSGESRSRPASGDIGRRRHFSGESIKKIFHLGKSNRSHSTSSESDLEAAIVPATTSNERDENIKEEEESQKSDECIAAAKAPDTK